jgi:triacylglycerol esterase/lipase EstA (alpha/beta hydrolase family)
MSTLNRVKASVAAVLLIIGLSVGVAGPARADDPTGPPLDSFALAFAYTLANPEANPPGANDWACRPTARHPRPVILVHGTGENRYNNWARMSPALKAEGYCVFALNYGALPLAPPASKGLADIRLSAKEFGVFVDRVLAATGASQVDLVGHSQGGLMPRQYLKFEGGANPADPSRNKVHTLVTLGAPHYGTTISGIGTLLNQLGVLGLAVPATGPALAQQIRGSEFLQTLNEGGATMPGITYVVIATRYDVLITPVGQNFLIPGPGATVDNITLQDGCEIDLSDHLAMPYSPRAIGYVENGLDPAHATPPPCVLHLPVF